MAEQDDVPELPVGIDKRALERAAIAFYSNPDRISTMPNDWIVTYGRKPNGKILIQFYRKVFGSPKVVSDMLEVSRQELDRILKEREEEALDDTVDMNGPSGTSEADDEETIDADEDEDEDETIDARKSDDEIADEVDRVIDGSSEEATEAAETAEAEGESV